MLPRELSGQPVDLAHPLDRYQKGFIDGEPGRPKVDHLVTEVSLQLLDVGFIDGPYLPNVGAPLGDL